ncbi:MAG: radical SAM protein, partial [Bacteroidales bacterium]|nr:radical SAM protein [Bacteroidales bacterium]
KNIHINIETSGHFDFERALPILSHINSIYFDIKHLDEHQHKKYTGLSNKLILNNFEKLNKIFPNIQIRIPLIPGVNDAPNHIKALSEFLIENGHKLVHLLPYHSMGNSKATRIDFPSKIFKVEPHTKEEITLIKSQFSKFGIKPITYE